MKKYLIICLLLIVLNPLISAEKVKFRKIEKELLEQAVHPIEAEAEAAVLFQYCRRYYNYNFSDNVFNINTYVHQRIKVYTKEGASWADFSLPFYAEGNIVRLKAYTYNLVDGKIEETKLENDNIFTEDISKYIKSKKFAMPSVAPGSVVDIEYEIVEPSLISFRPFYMQYAIPLDYCEYEVEIPEYYIFNKTIHGPNIKIDRKSDSKKDFLLLNSGNNSRVEFTVNIEQYIAENVPALKKEPFVPSMDNYRLVVNYELSYIKYPNSPIKNYSSTWDDVADLLYKSDNFGDQLDVRLSELNPIVDEAIQLPLEERYKKIYYYVRDTYSWNGNFGEQTEKGLKKLVSEKTGNSGDINLLLINLLKKAEVDVVPVVLSTQSNGFLNISYPSYAQLNYVIAMVTIEDKTIYLDATNKQMLAGYIPSRALNLYGVMIKPNKKAVKIDIVTPNNGSSNSFLLCELTDDQTLKGKARTIYSDYDAAIFRSNYIEAEKESGYVKKLHDTYPNLEVMEHSVDSIYANSSKVIETMDVIIENQAETIGDLIYLNPMLIWQDKVNEFKSEKREFSVFYNATTSDKRMISITLPEGYTIESLPKATRMVLPGNQGSFQYQISEAGGKIMIQYQYMHTVAIIEPQDYLALRNFMTLIIAKQAEKIVLKKTL